MSQDSLSSYLGISLEATDSRNPDYESESIAALEFKFTCKILVLFYSPTWLGLRQEFPSVRNVSIHLEIRDVHFPLSSFA